MGRKKKVTKKKLLIKTKKQNKVLPKKIVAKSTFKTAAEKIPILHVVGDADSIVPVSENSDLVESRYRELGGNIEVIRKNGVGHHPHCLKDLQPILDFFRKHSGKAGEELKAEGK